jgi:septum formation protein
MTSPFIYLASQSPRRLELLAQWGVECQTLLPDASEDAEALEVVRPSDTPMRYVRRVTQLKLAAALQRLVRRGLPPAPVLCADTTVALGARILGKPDDAEHAVGMLTALAGRTHRVLTAVAVGLPDGGSGAEKAWLKVSVSRVRFAPLSETQIRRYVQTGEPMGKAGAYGIQGRAALWTEQLSGSYTGIMGLPAFETAGVLREAGIALV